MAALGLARSSERSAVTGSAGGRPGGKPSKGEASSDVYDALGTYSLTTIQATFVPEDPGRRSWFALWDSADTGGLFGGPVRGLADAEIILARTLGTDVVAASIVSSRLEMGDAIRFFADLPNMKQAMPSMHVWATAVRSALALVAQGRLLPAVSRSGFETWQLKPLQASDRQHLVDLGAAMPLAGHSAVASELIGRERESADRRTVESPSPVVHQTRVGESNPFVLDAAETIRLCWDGVADRVVRTSAAGLVCSTPLFADRDPIRVPHLRAWAQDIHSAHSPGAGLSLRVGPPVTDGGHWQLVLLLRSRLDPSLVVGTDQLWRAPEEIVSQFGQEAEAEFLVSLRNGAQACPVLKPALEQSAPSVLELDDVALDSLVDHLDDLAAVGIEVRWPSGLVAPDLERRVVVNASSPSGALPTVTDLDSLLTVNWEFLLDGIPLTRQELSVLSEAKRPIVPIRGRWVRLDRKARERLKARVPTITAADAIAAALGTGLELDSGEPGSDKQAPIPVSIRGALKELADRLLALDGVREQAEPPGLAAELRPYQRRGLAWMADLCSLGLGGCLADDMGLGKTIQLLALHSFRGGATLVVCPTSLLANWERECHKFLPGVIVHRYHGANRSLRTVEKGDLVVTSYGVLRSDAEKLAEVEWDLVVADEAQYAKNPRSRTARSLRQIPANSRIALSGTPVENRLSELWSILDWTVPGLLGPLETFRRSLSIPIERDGDPEATAKLSAVIKPFLLRRKKTDPGIAPELPPKLERDVIVPLTPEQVTLYQATTKEVLADLQGNEGIARHGLVLKLLTALKQITNHPAQYLGETMPLAGRSGKLAALDEILASARAQQQSTLIFSQYVSMGELLVSHLRSQGIHVEMLHGGQSIKRRQELVDAFQANKLPVLILSLKAGGTGLNLTRATNVVHYDRWWNPAVEDQATDRAYRIGQDQTVTVHRLITEGTVEDRVGELLRQKRALADRVVGSGETWIGSLDDEQLTELVSLAPITTEVGE